MTVKILGSFGLLPKPSLKTCENRDSPRGGGSQEERRYFKIFLYICIYVHTYIFFSIYVHIYIHKFSVSDPDPDPHGSVSILVRNTGHKFIKYKMNRFGFSRFLHKRNKIWKSL